MLFKVLSIFELDIIENTAYGIVNGINKSFKSRN